MASSHAGAASLGRYRVLGRIASGGMAEVFAAYSKGEAGFERVVAIKRLAPALTEDEEFVRMFLHEARLAAQVRSANVVQTLDLGRDAEGTPYLVMDLVVGASLARLVEGAARLQSDVPVEVAVSILVDACRGLHEAHEATARDGSPLGIVHRDVSPQNILIGKDGIARVADFGIARALDTSHETTRDKMRGKLAYFSPEQASGTPLDRRSDVFSAGIVAWELLTGKRLFRDEHPMRILKRILRDRIPLADSVRSDVPPGIAAVVERALQRDPALRYATASQLEEALREASQSAGLQPHPAHVASFLAAACATEIAHIERLLRRRTSVRPDRRDRASGAGAAPRGAIGRPEERASPQTGEPVSGKPRHTPELARKDRSPPLLSRRQLWMAAGAVGLLSGAALAGLWGRRRMNGHGVSEDAVVHGPPPPPSSRSVLRIGTLFFTSIPASPLGPALFWSTIEPGPDGQAKASFVRRAPRLDNGLARVLPGGRFEVRWELLPSLKWSDGRPLRAEDLVLSQRLMPRAQVVESRKVDDETAVFVWTDHWAQSVGGFEPFPTSVLQPLTESAGRDAALEYRKTHATPGLGPYRIAEVKLGERMVLEPNPHFAGPRPSISRIELRCLKDSTQLMEQFECGELDMIVTNNITVEQAIDLKKRRPDGVHLRPSSHYVLIQPDITHPLLASIEARQALMSAIDRASLSRAVFGRTDLVAHCPIPGMGPGLVRTYSFDIAQASADFARLKLAGARLPLYHTSWSVDVRIAGLLREHLLAAGLDLELRQVERVSELHRSGRHGGFVLYSMRDAGPELPAAHFNLPVREAEYDRSVRHSGFDAWTASLLDREERAVDPQRRAQLRQELWMAFTERLPVLPLMFLLERVVVDPALRGWDGSPSQRFGADIEKWYFVGG